MKAELNDDEFLAEMIKHGLVEQTKDGHWRPVAKPPRGVVLDPDLEKCYFALRFTLVAEKEGLKDNDDKS